MVGRTVQITSKHEVWPIIGRVKRLESHGLYLEEPGISGEFLFYWDQIDTIRFTGFKIGTTGVQLESSQEAS